MRRTVVFSRWLHGGRPVAWALAMIFLSAISLDGSVLLAADGDAGPAIPQESDVRPAEQPDTSAANEYEVESRGMPLKQRQPPTAPGMTGSQVSPKLFVPAPPGLTWDQLWDQVWRSIITSMPIEVASSVRQASACQGNLAFELIVKDGIWAIANRKYGDAARLLGLFQDRSHCLTARGIRSLDAAMTVYLLAALRNLPRDQADITVPAIFNFGLLVFDQLQYTKATFWRIGTAPRVALMQQILTAYSSRDMGVWLYDFHRGLLVQRTEAGLKEEILNALANPSRLGDGRCSLLEMADLRQKSPLGFHCPQRGQYTAWGNAGQTASGAISGIAPNTSGAMCIAEVARTSGSRQQLACMDKAVAGIKPTPIEMLNGLVWSPPVLDKGCAISDAPAGGLVGSMQTVVDPKVLEVWQEAEARLRIEQAENEMLKKAKKDLAEAARLSQENAILRQELLESQGASPGGSGSTACPPSKLGCGPGEDKRTVGDDLGGSGGCGNASNGAKRLRALYQCLAGNSASSGPRTSGGGVSPNPTIAYINPDQQPLTKMPAALACAAQGGDMPRMTMNDPQCVAMRCMEGQICPCNKPASLGGSQMQPRPIGGATPDCIGEGPCGPKPLSPGGVTQPPPGPGIR